MMSQTWEPSSGAALAMSKARLVITAVVVEGRTHADVAAQYGLSRSWVTRLVGRYRLEGDTAFETKFRRPKTSPNKVADVVNQATVNLRLDLTNREPAPRRRPAHDPMAPRPARSRSVDLHHPAATHRRRTDRTRTEKAAEVVLHPLRSRPPQRNLAIRLPPLPPRQQRSYRSPGLAR